MVNFAQNKREAIDIFENFAKIIDNTLGFIASIEFLGFVPFDEKLQQAIRSQRAVIEMWPQAPSSCSFMEVARSILKRATRQAGGTVNFFAFSPVLKDSSLTLNKTDDGSQEFNLEK